MSFRLSILKVKITGSRTIMSIFKAKIDVIELKPTVQRNNSLEIQILSESPKHRRCNRNAIVFDLPKSLTLNCRLRNIIYESVLSSILSSLSIPSAAGIKLFCVSPGSLKKPRRFKTIFCLKKRCDLGRGDVVSDTS